MKNFGKGSWSSLFSVLLHIGWYIVLICSIAGAIFFTVIISSPEADKFITEQIAMKHAQEMQAFANLGNDATKFEKFSKMVKEKETTDPKDWEMFKNAPLALKLLAYPYCGAVVVLLLMIMSRSRRLFDNLKNNIIFNKNNVDVIGGINKLLIPFSIITFNFSGLLTCLLLYMLSEIFKDGAKLQEEHDLTV